MMKKVEGLSFHLGATEASSVWTAKNLGVIIDFMMNMEAQVTAVCKTAFYQLHNIEAI